MSQQASQRWPCAIRSIADVRQFVASLCWQWHLDEITDDLVLIASEMATNAVTHARSPFELSISMSNDQVRIEVSDDNPQFATTPAPAWRTTTLTGPDAARIDDVDFLLGGRIHQEDASGRGLMIVAALAASWGMAPSGLAPGKTVWATYRR